MTITVRPIRPGEGAVLLDMVRALADSHGFLDRVTAKPDDLEAALFRDDPVVGCLLALADDEPAGCAFWHRSFTTARGKEVIYLEDLSVLPKFRRRGIARRLVSELARLAVSRGIPSITWMMMGWNESARALYGGTGAEMEEGLVYCRLSDDALVQFAAVPDRGSV